MSSICPISRIWWLPPLFPLPGERTCVRVPVSVLLLQTYIDFLWQDFCWTFFLLLLPESNATSLLPVSDAVHAYLTPSYICNDFSFPPPFLTEMEHILGPSRILWVNDIVFFAPLYWWNVFGPSFFFTFFLCRSPPGFYQRPPVFPLSNKAHPSFFLLFLLFFPQGTQRLSHHGDPGRM